MVRFLPTCAALLLLAFAPTHQGLRRQQSTDDEEPETPHVKNGKLKSWAAASILNLEHQKCKRHSYDFTLKAKWWWQHCPAGWKTLGFGCRTCNGGHIGAFRCFEKCGAETRLPHLPVSCGDGYCVASKNDCVKAVTNFLMPWGAFAFNLVTNKSALEEATETLKSVKAAGKDSIEDLKQLATDSKTILKTALKETVDKIVDDTKDLLSQYLNDKAPSNKTLHAVVKGAAEVVALQVAANVNTKLKGIADKFLEAVDFSGVSGFQKARNAFDWGEKCRDVMIDPVPDTDVEEEDDEE